GSDGTYFGFNAALTDNDARPMTQLCRLLDSEGKISAASATVLHQVDPNKYQGIKLWAFDDRGRAIDAGAVAAGWAYLAGTVFSSLWAEASDKTLQRTADIAQSEQVRTLHLVSACEGALDKDQKLFEDLDTNAAKQVAGTDALWTISDAVTVSKKG